jgi:hypothetical protein
LHDGNDIAAGAGYLVAERPCYKRRMRKLSSLVVAITLAACGGGNKQPATEPTPTTPTTAAAAPASAGTVELGELKFYAGDDLGMQLHANGHLEVKMAHEEAGKPPETMWQDIGAIATDGTITTADGQKHGQITADGSLVSPDGKTAPFHIEGEALVIADKKITIDDKGIVQGGNDGGHPMRIEGATTPGLRRTALVLLAVVMASPDEPTPAP